MNLHAVLPCSRANGPGVRFTAWVQGCSRNCSGCFNQETHFKRDNLLISPQDLVGRVVSTQGIEGVSISGGEPLEQAHQLRVFLELLDSKKKRGKGSSQLSPDFSILLFSGFLREEIGRIPHGNEILSKIDVLIAGPFVASLAAKDERFLSSSNQTIHFLSDRYSEEDFRNLPTSEIFIDETGAHFSGVRPIPGLSDIRSRLINGEKNLKESRKSYQIFYLSKCGNQVE